MDAAALQVRAVVDLLPVMDVVEGDPFNSSPTDPKFMGPDVLDRWRRGEKLPTVKMRTPLVRHGKAFTNGACMDGSRRPKDHFTGNCQALTP